MIDRTDSKLAQTPDVPRRALQVRRYACVRPLLRAISIVSFCLGFCAASSSIAASDDEAGAKAAPRIVNIVNFIRGVEPRGPVDLLEPVRQQIRLAHEHKLPSTFLIQYDALVMPAFTDLLKKELGPDDELGAWLEVVQPQVEAAGLKWRGRYPWDWHTDVGFTIGYPPTERRKLMDVYMEQFKSVFGRLPRSVGCWVIDAPTLNYLSDQYGIVAACICKDQLGTDGYSLWGGYWNQAYYPSRRNAYMPAQTAAEQLRVPVFRMLGSDPIYQYDTGLGQSAQGVISLEPVYGHAGGNPAWVRWFFDANFRAPCLAFAYAQAGQENSFGWPAMSKGLTDQYQLLVERQRDEGLRVETLETSGKWFRETFEVTPATAVVALKDWRNEGRRAVWYESRFYRVNVLWTGTTWHIRDLHLFNEQYAERYLNEVVNTHHCTYDTLPVVDGFNWSDAGGTIAGLRFVRIKADGATQEIECGEPVVAEAGNDALLVTIPIKSGGTAGLRFEPRNIRFDVNGAEAPRDWALALTWDEHKSTTIVRAEAQAMQFRHNSFDYAIKLDGATFNMQQSNHSIVIRPAGCSLAISF